MNERTAVITGGTTGIGFACARVFLEAGYSVAICGRDEERGRQARAQLASFGDVSYIRADVREQSSMDEFIQQTVRMYGPPAVAVNNAAMGVTPTPFLDEDPSVWHDTILTNLTGVYHSMRAQLREMVKHQSGGPQHIVNISSICATVTKPGTSPYCASKAGVIALTRALALEYSSTNIRINAVSPAAVATEALTRNLPKAFLEEVNAAHPVGRIGEPEEIAKAVRWMTTNECNFITGHNLVADGGYSLR